MTTHISGSAKIYTFPPRGRFALRMGDGELANAELANAELANAVNLQLPRGVELTSGSGGWYHQEAIQESMHEADPRGRKN
ncbi:MAG: DUF2735 domain-containing protein [Xanthobacteraceae bacterium]